MRGVPVPVALSAPATATVVALTRTGRYPPSVGDGRRLRPTAHHMLARTCRIGLCTRDEGAQPCHSGFVAAARTGMPLREVESTCS